MPNPPPPIPPPKSYAALPFKEIKLSHYPPSSPDPTPIILLTLYRPEKYNAFTGTMMEELEQAYGILSVDDRVKVIVTTGAGRMFCAGADLQRGFKEGEGMESEREHRDGGGRVALAAHQCKKPIIGAINGAAVGVGMTMTLPFTIRVALSSAKIGFVFARRGLVSEGASSFFLPRLIGHAKALHVVTTGATYRADDQIFGGLFSETRDSPEEVLKRAFELAEEIAANTSAVSNYLIRELFWRGPGTAEETHLLDSRVLFGLRTSTDNEEGVKSFLEKRPVKFTGSVMNDMPPIYPWWSPVYTNVQQKATESLKPKL